MFFPGKNGKDGDSGSYHCVARNEHGEAQSREGTLKIAMLRDDFRTRPRTVQVRISTSVLLLGYIERIVFSHDEDLS